MVEYPDFLPNLSGDCIVSQPSNETSSSQKITTLHDHHGISRFVYLRPISAVSRLAGPIMTPSLIMSMTSVGPKLFRKNLWFALQAASTLDRACCILGSFTAAWPDARTPSESAMS